MTFDEIMAPLGAEAFIRDYLGQQPLHLQGPADKFEPVMNWEALNRLLGMTTVWTDQTHDADPGQRHRARRRAMPRPTAGREGGTVLRPDPARVQQYLARGATMVLNFIDQLTPELSALRPLAGAGLGRHGAGQPLSLVQAQAGLQGAFRLS